MLSSSQNKTTGNLSLEETAVIIRKKEVKLQAYCLGTGHPMEEKLLNRGLIRKDPDGTYRLFSQETRGEGQAAKPGDYFKVDSTGSPYPNDRAFFLENHTHLTGDWYLQQAKPLKAWWNREGMCRELRYILGKNILRVDENDPEKHYRAQLWGTTLYAPESTVIVFSQVDQDAGGQITHVDFYFLDRDIFLQTYDILEE